jgi:hypothetical protein
MMDTFDNQMNEYQANWRKDNVTSSERGWQNRKQYEWILPARLWQEGLWPGIRDGSQHPLPDYLRRNQVQKHGGVHNLKSSWMLCANLYFPFGASEAGCSLAGGVLQAHVCPQVRSVDALELEYAELGDLHPSSLLGEMGSGRGTGQTSPDLAFLVNGGRGLVLCEVKFVEHSFYSCSAHRHKGSAQRPGNPDPARCNDALAVLDDPGSLCHQVRWGRKYWEHLQPVFDRETVSSVRCCPAARAGYQLFRQQALAEGIAASAKYDWVVSCVALDERNERLQSCLRGTGIADVRQWGQLFDGKASFAVFSHQQWGAWVRAHSAGGQWTNWLSYVESRYGYEQ